MKIIHWSNNKINILSESDTIFEKIKQTYNISIKFIKYYNHLHDIDKLKLYLSNLLKEEKDDSFFDFDNFVQISKLKFKKTVNTNDLIKIDDELRKLQLSK